jgi:hypothetical protein
VKSTVVADGHLFIWAPFELAALTGETPTSTPTGTSSSTGDNNRERTTEESSAVETTTEFQSSSSLARQSGTDNGSQATSDTSFGVAEFIPFGDSEVGLNFGGLAATLGLGGGYAVYRRYFGGDESNED